MIEILPFAVTVLNKKPLNIRVNTIFQCGKYRRYVANNILIINVNILHNFKYCYEGRCAVTE